MKHAARSENLQIYIDESVHDALGFIVTAFVFSETDLAEPVADALTIAGLVPGQDEYKSGHYMSRSAPMRAARDEMLFVARGTKIALLVTSADRRQTLGAEILSALWQCIAQNDLHAERLTIPFDRGLVEQTQRTGELAARLRGVIGCELHFEQDSRVVLGLQAADFTAHAMAQVLREELGDLGKEMPLGPDDGYEEGTPASLGWILRVWLRHSFFTRPTLISTDDDIDEALHPQLIGWGVFMGDGLKPRVSQAVDRAFTKIWLGCVH